MTVAGLILATALIAQVSPAVAENHSTGLCQDKTLLTARIKCFLEAAEAAGDATICGQAQDPVVHFQCVSLYAEHTGDAAACKIIEAQDEQGRILRDSCVAGVAIASKDASLCGPISVPALRDSCYVQLVLEAGGDAALCGRVENKVLKEACTENVPGQN